MKSTKETKLKLTQKTVLITVGAVALIAIVAGSVLLITNHMKKSSMVPVETQETLGTNVFGDPVTKYVGDVGKLKYDMSSCASLSEVLAQIKTTEYCTPVGNVVIVDAGKYGDDEVASQGMRAVLGEDLDQESSYFIHVRMVQTATDDPSWIDHNVAQSLITMIQYEAFLDDGISSVTNNFMPAYVDDDGRWSIMSVGLTEGQVRDVYYVADLRGMSLDNGNLTIAVGPNDEMSLTYYNYSMNYNNVQGLAPEELNPQTSATN